MHCGGMFSFFVAIAVFILKTLNQWLASYGLKKTSLMGINYFIINFHMYLELTVLG